jgi:RNA polymerase sigma-70 factor (ECF subfamily)
MCDRSPPFRFAILCAAARGRNGTRLGWFGYPHLVTPPPRVQDDPARRLFEWGRARHPAIKLDFAVFAGSVARHGARLAELDEGRAADLYLACGCAQGDRAALNALEEGPLRDAARAAASVCSSSSFVEEVMQTVREALVARRGKGPGKIAEYAGRASLKSWLCTVAARTAISLRRRVRQGVALTSSCDPRPPQGGPDVGYLRRITSDAVRRALGTAIERLPAKERLLLRLHLGDRVGIDGLAGMYGVGRSTAARWLADARATLLKEAQRELRSILGVTKSELTRLAPDVQSHIDVSLVSLLRSPRP